METGIHELTAGYALDALEPEERRAYEAHLEGCEQCREELAAFWQTTEALAVAASGPAPSGGLRERILSQARQEPQVVVPLASRRRRTVPVLAAAAAVAAVVALALGLWAAGLSSDLDDTRAALERERAAGAITFSAGNAAQGLAYAGAIVGVKTTIVMPGTASPAKAQATRDYGGEVILAGTAAECMDHCLRLAEERGWPVAEALG